MSTENNQSEILYKHQIQKLEKTSGTIKTEPANYRKIATADPLDAHWD